VFSHPDGALGLRLVFGLAVCILLWKRLMAPQAANSVCEKFWSLHCCRLGARSHVACGGKKLARCCRTAEAQVHKHGWRGWRRCQRSWEKIDVMVCLEWLICDRIKIALCSMKHGFVGFFLLQDLFMVAEMVWCV
jgi:hypothetical protein